MAKQLGFVIAAVSGFCGILLAQGSNATVRSLPQALACSRAALGGNSALSAVSSLAFAIDIVPTPAQATNGVRPAHQEIALTLPDKYKNVSRAAAHTTMISGFAGAAPLYFNVDAKGTSRSRVDDATIVYTHHQFARLLFAWLLRDVPAMPLATSLVMPPGAHRIAIAASGATDFNMILSLDDRTCLPVEMTFRRPSNTEDLLRDQAAGRMSKDVETEAFALSGYRKVGGVMFPALMVRSVEGLQVARWTILNVQVNPHLPMDTFAVK